MRLALSCLALLLALPAAAQPPLEAIDRPQRRLQVSVRFDDAFESSQRRSDERVDQRLYLLEGARGTILAGQSRPVRQRQIIQTPAGPVPQDVVVVQERTAGFEVVPRLAGGGVAMEIVSANTVQTVRGPLGEWFELGAIGARRVWAKVEPLDK